MESKSNNKFWCERESFYCILKLDTQKTIKAMNSGQLNPKQIVTSQIELDEIVEKGFEALTNDKTKAKILVELSGEK